MKKFKLKTWQWATLIGYLFILNIIIVTLFMLLSNDVLWPAGAPIQVASQFATPKLALRPTFTPTATPEFQPTFFDPAAQIPQPTFTGTAGPTGTPASVSTETGEVVIVPSATATPTPAVNATAADSLPPVTSPAGPATERKKATLPAQGQSEASEAGVTGATEIPPTSTATSSPTATATATSTATPKPTATATSTATSKPTATATATSTTTPKPTATATATATATSSTTPSPTATATTTATFTATPKPTATATPTSTATPKPAATSTSTTTLRPAATAIATSTATPRPSNTATATSTATPSPTSTATATPEPTATSTATPRPTAPAIVLPAPTSLPAVEPLDIQVNALTDGRVGVNWNASGKGQEYRIYSDMGTGYGVYVYKSKTRETAFLDNTSRPGMLYSYKIETVSSGLVSAAGLARVLSYQRAAVAGVTVIPAAGVSSGSAGRANVAVIPAPTPLPPDAMLLGLMSDASFTDEFNILSVVGEVRNDSNLDVGDITVVVSFYDAAGSFISETSGHTLLKTLTPGGRSSFLLNLSSPPGMSNYSVKAVGRPVPPQLNPQISVVKSQAFEDEIGFYHVTGVVKNTGSVVVSRAKVIATLYNRGGGVINVNFAYPVPAQLNPGDTASFDVTFTYFPKVLNHAIVVAND